MVPNPVKSSTTLTPKVNILKCENYISRFIYAGDTSIVDHRWHRLYSHAVSLSVG